MEIGTITALMGDGVKLVLTLCAPVLGAALVIGLVVAIFQAVTSIQEQTLTFLPKMVVILVAIGLLGGWMFTRMEVFTLQLFAQIPALAR